MLGTAPKTKRPDERPTDKASRRRSGGQGGVGGAHLQHSVAAGQVRELAVSRLRQLDLDPVRNHLTQVPGQLGAGLVGAGHDLAAAAAQYLNLVIALQLAHCETKKFFPVQRRRRESGERGGGGGRMVRTRSCSCGDMSSVAARARAKEPVAAKNGAQPRWTGDSASMEW